MTKKCSLRKAIFYLYFRQIYKLITANYFINDKTIETNPSKLTMSKKKSMEIIREGLYNFPELLPLYEGSFYKQFQSKQLFYYEFMNFLWYSDVFDESQDFFKDLVALYDFKNKPEIYKINFSKKANDTSKNVVKSKIMESEYDYYIS